MKLSSAAIMAAAIAIVPSGASGTTFVGGSMVGAGLDGVIGSGVGDVIVCGCSVGAVVGAFVG